MEPLQGYIQAIEPHIDVLLSSQLAETVRAGAGQTCPPALINNRLPSVASACRMLCPAPSGRDGGDVPRLHQPCYSRPHPGQISCGVRTHFGRKGGRTWSSCKPRALRTQWTWTDPLEGPGMRPGTPSDSERVALRPSTHASCRRGGLVSVPRYGLDSCRHSALTLPNPSARGVGGELH